VSIKSKYILIIIVAILLTIIGVLLSFFDSSRIYKNFIVDTYILPIMQTLLILYFVDRANKVNRVRQKSVKSKQLSGTRKKVIIRLIFGLLSVIFVFNLVLYSRRFPELVPLSIFMQFIMLILLPVAEIWLTFDKNWN
jgi:hypothetical protein